MPKSNLEMGGGGGGGKVSPKNLLALWALVWSKNKEVAWAPPLDPPIQMHHAGLQ